MNQISSISNQPMSANILGKAAAPTKDGVSFQDFMLKSLDQVNSMQQDAELAVEKMFSGGDVNPAEVLTAVQKADMSFKLMMQVRNKLVDAFHKIEDIRI